MPNNDSTSSAIKSSTIAARILARATLWMTLGNYINQLIGFGSILIMTRLIQPEVFGYFSLAAFWYGILNLRAKLGLNYSGVTPVNTDGVLLGTYYKLDVIAVISTAILGTIGAYIMWLCYLPTQVIAILLVFISTDVITFWSSTYGLALERELQLSRVTLIQLGSNLIAYPTAIFLAWSGREIYSLLVISIINSTVSSIGIYFLCKKKLPRIFNLRRTFDKTLAENLLRSGVSIGLSAMALSVVVFQFDNFLIGTFVDLQTLGFYDRAYRIAQWPNILITLIISRVGFLTFTKFKHDTALLRHSVQLVLWLLIILSIPISLTLFFSAQPIINLLYGSKWTDSSHFLRFLSISNLMWTFVSLGFWLSASLNERKTNLILSVLSAICIIVITLPLTLLFKANGTVAGVACSMTISAILSLRYITKRVNLVFSEAVLRPLLAALVTLSSVAAIKSWHLPDTEIAIVTIAINFSLVITVFIVANLLLNKKISLANSHYIYRMLRPQPTPSLG